MRNEDNNINSRRVLNMDTNNNTNSCYKQEEPQGLDEELMMSDPLNKRLLSEYAFVRTRQEASAPDVEAAWQRFDKSRKASGHKARLLAVRCYAAAAIVVCAIVSAVYLFFASERDDMQPMVDRQYAEYVVNEKGNVLAFEATDGPRVVMMGNADQTLEPIVRQIEDDNIKADEEKAVVMAIPAAKVLDIAKKTITTPRGATYDIELSDGTRVKLNADSKLTFPVNFNGSERIVELVGEAFFSVARDEARPFIVKTVNANTTVLGTEFDVRAYDDMLTSVVLKNGKVRVNSNVKADEEVTMEPDQSATIRKDGTIALYKADAEKQTMWTTGNFCFDMTPLLVLTKEMGRWYNVNIEIEEEVLDHYPISFEMSRECGLAEFIEKLNSLGFLDVTLQENNVMIKCKGGILPAMKVINSDKTSDTPQP